MKMKKQRVSESLCNFYLYAEEGDNTDCPCCDPLNSYCVTTNTKKC